MLKKLLDKFTKKDIRDADLSEPVHNGISRRSVLLALAAGKQPRGKA